MPEEQWKGNLAQWRLFDVPIGHRSNRQDLSTTG